MLQPIHSEGSQDKSNNKEIKCPRCGSSNLNSAGMKRDKQRYLCHKCQVKFTGNPQIQRASDVLPPNITPEEMLELDIWDLRVFGLKPSADGHYTLNFSVIANHWLKIAVKHWLRYRISIDAPGTICIKLTQLKGFAKFVDIHYPNLFPQQLSRNIIVDYLFDLMKNKKSTASRLHYIISLNQFLDDCGRFNWADVPKERLIPHFSQTKSNCLFESCASEFFAT